MATYYKQEKGDLFDLSKKLDKFLKEVVVEQILELEEIDKEAIEEIIKETSGEREDILFECLEEMEGDKHPEVVQENLEFVQTDLKLAHSLLERLVEILGNCQVEGTNMTTREYEQVMFEIRHSKFETI